jgi:hypothetical protein
MELRYEIAKVLKRRFHFDDVHKSDTEPCRTCLEIADSIISLISAEKETKPAECTHEWMSYPAAPGRYCRKCGVNFPNEIKPAGKKIEPIDFTKYETKGFVGIGMMLGEIQIVLNGLIEAHNEHLNND